MTKAIRIEGEKELIAALKKFGADGEREIDKVVQATGIEIRGDIVKMYQRSTPTGRVYKKSSPRRTHRASAPGEPPATDTGRLASSVRYKKVAQGSAEVDTQVKYGAWLEFGTLRIAKRPAWLPASEAARPKFKDRLERALARLINR